MDIKLVISLLESAIDELKKEHSTKGGAPEGGNGSLPTPRRKPQRIFSPEFWAIVDACGMNREEVSHAPSRVAKTLAAIVKFTPGVTEEQIVLRALRYRAEFPKCTLSPEALAKHWPSLSASILHEGKLTEV